MVFVKIIAKVTNRHIDSHLGMPVNAITFASSTKLENYVMI